MGQVATLQQRSPLLAMAERLSLDSGELEQVLKKTIMPAQQVSNEQFVAFLSVANAYALNPLKKEIYAFPGKGGQIQPIVSIDGWLSIINSRPEYDGMELRENFENGKIFSVTCSIFRKDQSHPTVVTEYLDECIRNTEPWKKPVRMLRHKATIQCARYAFGLGGIMEQDEAEAAFAGEKDVTPVAAGATRVETVKSGLVIEADAVTLDEVLAAIESAGSTESLSRVAAEVVSPFLSAGGEDHRDAVTDAFKARRAALEV